MAEPKNRQQFVELEYCLDKYFNNYFTPIIKSESERFRRNAEVETRNRKDGGWGGYIDAASPFTTTHVQQASGEWNKKTTEDLLEACNSKFLNDPKVQEDISKMTIACRASLVSELGVERYKQMSKGVPTGDLASFYVCNRFQQLFIEKLAQMKAPRNSFEFILQKGIGDSLPGLMAGAQMKHSALDAEVKSLSEKFYGANFVEKTAAFGLSFVVDTALTGGYGSVGKAATWLAIDGGLRLGTSFLPQGKSFDQLFSEEVWGDKNTIDAMRRDSRKVNPQQSEDITALNSVLNKQMYHAKYDDKAVLALCNKIKSSVGQENGAGLVQGLESGFKELGFSVNKKGNVPAWMKEKSDKDLYHYACYWSAMAMEMKSKGIQKIVVGKKTYTVEQITQKGYDYARALSESQARNRSAQSSQGQNVEHSARPQIGQSAYVAQSVQTTGIQQSVAPQQSVQQTTQQTAVAAQTTEQVAGWGGMLDQMGLGGFGEVGKNLGYVLAMLPDMLIGMFTGKSRNLKFGDNLLPIGAIIMGMFTKNPLLKMLLIGLGGANLLNKAGHEILENRDGVKSKPVQQYRQYGDEPLDSRIKDPAMKGNTLIATIDGVPSIITISSADAVDAYYKGILPLNTLSNAVLRKYDEQQQAVQENFDRQVAADETVERSRGLK